MSGSKPVEKRMIEHLQDYIRSNVLNFTRIPEKRKTRLNSLASYIFEQISQAKTVDLLFICTHNSRRSHMSQLWAQVAALYYQVPGIECFSGGTEATAFNPRAVKALKKAGFQIEAKSTGSNPVYMVTCAEGIDPVKAFSKEFSDPFNPQEEFAAVMTCSDADEACPFVPGASTRFSIPYEDPGTADGTPEEEAIYDKRCRQIATEMFYLFAHINW